MRRITLQTKESKSNTSKRNWVFMFKDMAELCPQNSQDFVQEQAKLSTILDIVESMTGKELNAFADLMRTKTEYQRLYRDGHWLDSPEHYNTKTQTLIDNIFQDLRDFRTEQLASRVAKAVRKSFN